MGLFMAQSLRSQFQLFGSIFLGFFLGFFLRFLFPQPSFFERFLDGFIESSLGDMGLLELTRYQLAFGGVVDEFTTFGKGYQHLHIRPCPVAGLLILAIDNTQLGKIRALCRFFNGNNRLCIKADEGYTIGAFRDKLHEISIEHILCVIHQKLVILVFGNALVFNGAEILRHPIDPDICCMLNSKLSEALTKSGLVEGRICFPTSLF